MLNNLLKSVVIFFLKGAVRLYLLRSKPIIIGIFGTEGKSHIRHILTKFFKDQKAKLQENSMGFNTEIGLPLSILLLPTGKKSFITWLSILFSAYEKALFSRRELFPHLLILEYGVDKKGESKKLLRIAEPDIVIGSYIRPRTFGDELFLKTMTLEANVFFEGRKQVIINSQDQYLTQAVKGLPSFCIKQVDIENDVHSFIDQVYNAYKIVQ